jgi:hypothetical protein
LFRGEAIQFGRRVYIRAAPTSAAWHDARRLYDGAIARGCGVALDVLDSLVDCSFAFVVAPSDALDAECRMIGTTHVKMSVPVAPRWRVVPVKSRLYWGILGLIRSLRRSPGIEAILPCRNRS